jgi:hypothetical protein
LLDRLSRVRDINRSVGIAGTIHAERLRQFVREGYISDSHQLGRYATRRRRAILVATILDLEARLTDAVLNMADKLIGGLFAKARNATRRHYTAGASDVARLMRLFHGTIEALAVAHESDLVDEAVGWANLLRVRGEVENLADLADKDFLLRAADRWWTLHKFAVDLIEALGFRAARPGDPMLAALKLLGPYRGKPAVRDLRGDDGEVGNIRRPVRAIVLSDNREPARNLLLPPNAGQPILNAPVVSTSLAQRWDWCKIKGRIRIYRKSLRLQ